MLQNMIFINGGVSPRIYKIRDEQAPNNQETYCTGQLEERIGELEHIVQRSDEENESLKRQLCSWQVAYSRLMQQLICQEQFTVSLSPKVLESLYHQRKPMFWEGCSETFKRSITSKMEENRKETNGFSEVDVSRADGRRRAKTEDKSGWKPLRSHQNLYADTGNPPHSDEPVFYLSDLKREKEPDSQLHEFEENLSERGKEVQHGKQSAEQAERQESGGNHPERVKEVQSDHQSVEQAERQESGGNHPERVKEVQSDKQSAEQAERQGSGENHPERVKEIQSDHQSVEQAERQESGGNHPERVKEVQRDIQSVEQAEREESGGNHPERGKEIQSDNQSVEQVEKDPLTLTGEKDAGQQYEGTEDDMVPSEHPLNAEKKVQDTDHTDESTAPVRHLDEERYSSQGPFVSLLRALPSGYPVAFVHTEGSIIEVLRFAGLDEPNRSANFISDKGLVSIPYTHINGIVFR